MAALYVQTGGAYYGLDGVDPWNEARDARLYAGPHPVVAHPPCARWGRYWSGGPSARVRRELGDDDGCFAAALASVRQWGGVLEHPEASHAWRAFGLCAPPRYGGWVNADFQGGWTCCVEQGHYGHRAKKATWLYVNGVMMLPRLIWGPSAATVRLDQGSHAAAERKAARAHRTMDPDARKRARDAEERDTGVKLFERLSARERAATPEPFRDLLLSIARSALRTRRLSL